jgi:hypothetical protein
MSELYVHHIADDERDGVAYSQCDIPMPEDRHDVVARPRVEVCAPCSTLFRIKRRLASALAVLAEHDATPSGMCTCGRPWDCSVAGDAAEAGAALEKQLVDLRAQLEAIRQAAVVGPTVLLPTVEAQ